MFGDPSCSVLYMMTAACSWRCNNCCSGSLSDFREKDHFDYLEREVLPRIAAKGQAKPGYPLRVWSAGCRSRFQGITGRLSFMSTPFCIIGARCRAVL